MNQDSHTVLIPIYHQQMTVAQFHHLLCKVPLSITIFFADQKLEDNILYQSKLTDPSPLFSVGAELDDETVLQFLLHETTQMSCLWFDKQTSYR